ncbi:MAG: DUF3300 domain-containing protein [Colwellia sp.]|uniref:DUF3300 domain-containing protein n=1 Tax=Colwellia sp. TaxID=56799 RepID=UPI001D542784|nr:DUF3300 domain-containing protein [Colwellia sp.]NQY49262.1 DUF3300 domain-containing protein [Colwellia sp.]
MYFRQPLWHNRLKYPRIRWLFLLSALVLLTIVFSTKSLAQEEQEPLLSEAELAQTLAPIALYPDTLLTHILIASTYPIEVIEAERWLDKHSTLTIEQVHKKSAAKDWDASIKALLAFPQVMAKLSEDLTWMQKLGDAFLQDEARVLASIQTLRQQAEQAGSLANMDNVQVIKDQQVIIIEPTQPEIIYVPYYDTRVVYGRWHWSHYPPVYWHNPHYYATHHGHFYWGTGIHISSHFFFSAFHWHNRHVVVNHYNRHGYHPRNKIVISHHAKRWSHQPQHRRGVAYSSGRLKQKYYGTRPSSHHNKVVRSSNVHRNKAVHSSNIRSTNVKGAHVRSSNVKGTNLKNNNTHVTHTKSNKVHSKKQVKKTVHHSNNKHYLAHKQPHLNSAVNSQAVHHQAKQSKSYQSKSVYKHPVSKSLPKQSSKQATRHSTRQAPKHTVRANKQHQTKHH